MESEQILQLLREQGCNQAQGYRFTRPPPAELATWHAAQVASA